MTGSLIVLLYPISLLLFNANLPLPFFAFYSLLSFFLNTNKYLSRLLVFIGLLLLFAFLSSIVISENLNLFFSSIFITISSSFFVVGSRNIDSSKFRWLLTLSLYLLVFAALINRLFFPDLIILGPEYTDLQQSVILPRPGGWTRDGLFGANVVSMICLLLNIAIFNSSRFYFFTFLITSTIVSLVYSSRFFVFLSIVYYIFFFVMKRKLIVRVSRNSLLIFSLVLITLLFLLIGGLEFTDFQRCDTQDCLGRFAKISAYFHALHGSSLSELLLGRSFSSFDTSSLNTFAVTLSDNSYLESMLSMGIPFTIVFLFLPLIANVYSSIKHRRDFNLLFIDIIFILFMSLYTVVRMTPVVMVYAQIRLYFLSRSCDGVATYSSRTG